MNTPSICGATPWSHEARAWHGDQLIARSRSAQRIERDGNRPLLLFPLGDLVVAPDALPAEVVVDHGADGFVAYDDRRVRVELVDAVDAVDADTADDPPVIRFPPWGDVADLVDVIDVRPDGDGRYVPALRGAEERSIVEGSQLLAQTVVAGCRETPGRRVVSASMTFLRVVHDTMPYVVELETVSSGRSFSSFVAHVVQDDRRCASGVVLLGSTSPDVIRHQVDAPDVAGPAASEPVDLSVVGRDVRVVDGAYTNDSDAPVGPPVIDAWLRYRGLPDDPAIHAGVLAHFTGQMSIAAAMRPHAGIGQDQSHRTLSTAPMAISLSVHAEVRADDWLLYHHDATFAGDGLAHSDCRVHNRDGGLVASFAVESMIKGFASKQPMDRRAVL